MRGHGRGGLYHKKLCALLPVYLISANACAVLREGFMVSLRRRAVARARSSEHGLHGGLTWRLQGSRRSRPHVPAARWTTCRLSPPAPCPWPPSSDVRGRENGRWRGRAGCVCDETCGRVVCKEGRMPGLPYGVVETRGNTLSVSNDPVPRHRTLGGRHESRSGLPRTPFSPGC